MASMLQVLVTIHTLMCAVNYADCETYHIAFLGRNQTLNPHVGTIFYLLQTPADVFITSAVENCMSNDTTFSIPGTSSVEVAVNNPECIMLIPSGTEIRAMAIKIESASDMTVHVYQNDGNGNAHAQEGYLAIPDQHLGNEYYVVTYCSFGGVCQFAVAGVTNSTYVYVIFPDDVTVSSVCVDGVQLPSSAPSGSAVPFKINEYQVLHFESESDMTGTYVWSDYNVAVFVGARDVPTSTGSPLVSSHLIEQLPPVQKWGVTFVAAPNYLNDAGDIVKILTKDDNTVVHISGFSPFRIPNKGGFIEKRIDWQMHSRIEASNPILIVQIMSVDIYNEPIDITGSPAMVLVPHIEQWTTSSESPFYCHPVFGNQTLIAVVSETDLSLYIPILPTPTVFYSPWTVIEGTDYSVQMFEPYTQATMVYGPKKSAYGFCDGTAALLLEANWTWENEACVQTAVTQGDDVDNDCDGDADEEDCKGEDLVTVFTSQQNISGDVNFKAVNIRGAGYINVKIKTCDIAMVTLQTSSESIQRINIQVSPTSVSTEFCTNDCSSVSTETNTVADCDVRQQYLIRWTAAPTSITHTFITNNNEYVWEMPASNIVEYDQIIVSAFAGTADFEIGLPQKDCKKVPRVFADTHGSNFLLPVHNTDIGYLVLMSAHDSLSNDLTIELDVENSIGRIELASGQTKTFSNEDVTASEYDRIIITVTGGEMSVLLFRSAQTGNEIQAPILPTDVLGPSYQVFKHSDTNASLTGTYCDVYTSTRKAITNAGTIPLGINLEINQSIYDDLGTSHLIKSDRPLAVFCGTFTDTMLQMPPIETLGKQHFIPELNLTNLSADAEILVQATEDSTVVTVRGDYDQLDTFDLTGETITRTIVTNTVYNITASKPVQVILQVRSAHWATVVGIPPIEQYKTVHVFPKVITGLKEIIFSSAVDADGISVVSLVNDVGASTGAITYVYTNPTFSLTVMKYMNTEYDKYFIIPSDVLYNDINEVCTLTTGSPGDGIDNDCDGLSDEEQCSDSKIPGNVDFDIDGSLNEDCASGTSTAANVLTLTIPSSMITCPPASGNVSDVTSNDGIEISGTNTTDDSDDSPKIPNPGTGHLFEPFILDAPIIIIQSDNDSTSVPVETCYTECVCPCGWITSAQNYTKEELEASVVEIQEKLAIKKEELSTVVRRKTSASDDRTSATAVGLAGLSFLVVAIGTVALLDIATLIRDVQVLLARMFSGSAS